MSIEYQTHVQDLGWLPKVKDGQISGTVGQHRRVEAFNIQGLDIPGLGIHGFAHVQNIGWTEGKILRQDIGTTGQGLHIEAIKIGLIGEQAENYDIWYRVHVADYGWMNWAHNGEECGTVGGNKQVEALQIEVHPRSEGWNPTVQTFDRYLDLTPQNPPQPQAPNILDVARGYIGYLSYSEDDSVFGRRLVGEIAGNWCCYFCVCCALEAGLSVPITGYCPYMMDWAEETGRFTYNPQPGYFVLYDWDGNGVPNHIGIVEEVYSSDDILACEGNTDQGNGVGVYRVHRDYGILGYVNPF